MLVLYLVRLHALVVIRPRRMQEIDRSQDVLVQLGVHAAAGGLTLQETRR
jgi:hypothetical protein